MNNSIGNVIGAMAGLAQGNPGCMEMLVRIMKHDPDEFVEVARMMHQRNLFADKAYMLWNDACDRDIGKFMRVVRAINSGRLSIDTVRQHMAGGRCEPFTELEALGDKKFVWKYVVEIDPVHIIGRSPDHLDFVKKKEARRFEDLIGRAIDEYAAAAAGERNDGRKSNRISFMDDEITEYPGWPEGRTGHGADL